MSGDQDSKPIPVFWKLVACLLLGAGLIARFVALEHAPGVNGDEAWLGWKAFQVAHGAALDWRTNSGNFTDPFYILPLVLLHKIFLPSVPLLRSVAVLSGVAVIFLNFHFCRKIFDRGTAVASTLLLALLPVCIIYSRFGWEPSQSILFALPVYYVALELSGVTEKRKAAGLLFLGFVSAVFAVLVHPANFFLAGVLLAGALACLVKPEASPRRFALFAAVLVAGVSCVGFMAYEHAPAGVHREIATRVGGFAWLHDGWAFLLVWLRIFNGMNSVSYVSGAWPEARNIFNTRGEPTVCWPDSVALAVFITALTVLIRAWILHKRSRQDLLVRQEMVLVLGFVTTSLLFGLMNGPEKIAVWNERYGLWAVVGGVLIVSRAWSRLQELLPSHQNILKVAASVLCILLMTMTASCYFGFMLKTGGESEAGFRVGTPECHEEAGAIIWKACKKKREKIEGFHPTVISSDWFVYWPTVYLLSRHPEVKQWEMILKPLYPEYRLEEPWKAENAVREGRAVFADVPESRSWQVWGRLVRESKVPYQSEEVTDLKGRPAVRIMIPQEWFADKTAK